MKSAKAKFGGTSFLQAAWLATLLLLPAAASSAQTSVASVVGLFPKQMTDFGYAGMKTARTFPWFEQVQKQLLPANLMAFEEYVTSTALSPNSQLNELYWGQAVIPDDGVQIVGVALGEFDLPATEEHLKSLQLPYSKYQGFHLYALGSGESPGDMLFFFMDSSTAAFGQRAALQELIDVRTGAADSFLGNDSLFPLVNAADSDALLWAALDRAYAQKALQDFLPEASQFPQMAGIRDRLKALIIQLDAPLSSNDQDSLNVTFQAVCGSPDDANLIAAAMQVALMYRHSQAGASDPQLGSILDQARVIPRGDTLEVHFSIAQQDILAFLVAAGAK